MEKYEFTQEDLQFVQSLFPDTVQVFLRDDNTTMDTCYIKNNKYIRSAYINFSSEFFKEIEEYFSNVGKVTWNNTGSCWWIYYQKNK